jgi:hypothetical protein
MTRHRGGPCAYRRIGRLVARSGDATLSRLTGLGPHFHVSACERRQRRTCGSSAQPHGSEVEPEGAYAPRLRGYRGCDDLYRFGGGGHMKRRSGELFNSRRRWQFSGLAVALIAVLAVAFGVAGRQVGAAESAASSQDPHATCSRGQASSRTLPDRASYRANEQVALRYELQASGGDCALPARRVLTITDSHDRVVFEMTSWVDCDPGPCMLSARPATFNDEWDQVEVHPEGTTHVAPGHYRAETEFHSDDESSEPVMTSTAEFDVADG